MLQPQNTPRDAQEEALLQLLFDRAFYLGRYHDVGGSGMDPFDHFMEFGAFEGRSPHPLFDTPFYLTNHPELAKSGMNPVLHFLRIGGHTASDPHPLFDSVYYFDRYIDIGEAGAIPLIHYLQHGAAELRDPHPAFNTAEYIAAHPEVAASGVNPLIHYVCSGAAEGRPPYLATTNRQIEWHRRHLATARMHIAYLQRELKTIYRNPAWRPTPKGKLIRCTNPVYEGRVFYCLNGKRHWIVPPVITVPSVPSQEHLDSYGLSMSDLVLIDDDEMRRYQLAGALPLPWPEDAWKDPPRLWPYDLREISTSKLRGSGIEFGAGTCPMSVPLGCEVKFADFLPQTDLDARAYTAQGKDFVRLTYVMNMEEMGEIPDGSLDFVIACHVIEHLRNPLRAFEQVYRKLKPGGQYVLVVPEMRRTFDKPRNPTPLAHLVEDFEDPSAERDATHYFEFWSKVYSIPDEELEAEARKAIATKQDLHFHAWTYENFREVVKYTRRHFAPWHSVWSQPPIWEDEGSHEFNFVLTK